MCIRFLVHSVRGSDDLPRSGLILEDNIKMENKEIRCGISPNWISRQELVNVTGFHKNGIC
jgi:hypothetical protein